MAKRKLRSKKHERDVHLLRTDTRESMAKHARMTTGSSDVSSSCIK